MDRAGRRRPVESGRVVAVSKDAEHRFSKRSTPELNVIAGLGIEGDAHQGTTVQHRSRVAVNPSQPNLRQVHLIPIETLDELRRKGFAVGPADLGENVTTESIDLSALPRGSLLKIGATVVLEITGLRNPCVQIEQFLPGLLKAVVDKGSNGDVILKAGIMTVVREGGAIRPGDPISVELPPMPHLPLERV
ncbi:MAG: MOSC domain-containing protein [Methylobacterium sp. CG08_land_8_20_14_0_20_71_15]|nr:MAG: MOSC domain-containing protein [Methylobacterium sp. CG09_land_8_20_14_0_10_71_15]PIU13275.1 MAG: MOSC domain-containing protein [Methylobacterium sp. CG08_land_8_20_14_0_20_71_15]